MKKGVIRLLLVPFVAVMLMGNAADATAAAETGGAAYYANWKKIPKKSRRFKHLPLKKRWEARNLP